jgi:hypothetical protein
MPTIATNLQETLAQMGLGDYSDLFGGTEGILERFGLPSEYGQFFMPFPQEMFGQILSGLPAYAQQERGFVKKKFREGRQGLQQSLLGGLMGLRQQAGASGFAGAGAFSNLSRQVRREAGSQYGGLLSARAQGLAGVEERVQQRLGQAQSLLSDYLSNVFSQALQIKQLSPTETESTERQGGGFGNLISAGSGFSGPDFVGQYTGSSTNQPVNYSGPANTFTYYYQGAPSQVQYSMAGAPQNPSLGQMWQNNSGQ